MTVFRLLVDCFDDLKAGALHGLDVLARSQQLGCCIVSFDACPNVNVFLVCAVERIRETSVDDRRFRAALQQPVLFAERERLVGRVAHGLERVQGIECAAVQWDIHVVRVQKRA